MDRYHDVDQSADRYARERESATRDWALRRQEQIDLAQKSGKPLSIMQRIYYGPGNLINELATDLAERRDTNHQRTDDDRWNVYEAMMRAAHTGQPVAPELKSQWELLKRKGHL